LSNSAKFQNPQISLCFDTSSQDLHLCLKKGDDFFDKTVLTNSGHAMIILSEIQTLLTAHRLTVRDIQLIVCAAGPGSFTGLRIGISTAKGLSLGNGCPYIGVNTLDAWASQTSLCKETVLAVIDARKNKYYGAFYEKGKRTSEYMDESANHFASLAPKSKKITVIGPHCIQFLGELNLMEDFLAAKTPAQNPARSMLLLGLREHENRGTETDLFGPLYIRKSDAELSLKTQEDI
jgi:tRNA threonylcarbamoyladenosine biosynthesis protein TsaB